MAKPEPKPRVLVVDDKLDFAETVADGLADHGYDAVPLASGREALVRLEQESFDALVTDLRMPEMDGLELISAARKVAPHRPIIVMTAFGGIDSAIESIRRGAYHYLTKPFKREELLIFLARALEEVRLRQEAAALKATLGERARTGILGRSKAVRDALEVLARVAKSDVPVLFTGETGTGKGLWAQTLHLQSPRAHKPFVSINCAALPDALLESELFGHLKGSFTGATENHAGLFVEADGGTLLLDEIGEMSGALQAKLLHVLEARSVRPVGATKERPIDVRIITATHRDLSEGVRAGTFREDFLYRLDVVALELPALRHRREDIPELVEHFLQTARAKHPSSPVLRVGPDAVARLLDAPWPGNVRQLSHVIERLVVLGTEPVVGAKDLPASVLAPASATGPLFQGAVVPIRELQTRYAAWALEQLGGHKGRTAETLGVDAKTLSKWLAREQDDATVPAPAPNTAE